MPQGRSWLGRAGCISGLALWGLVTGNAADSTLDEFALPSSPSPWFTEFNVRTAAGYKNNVALSSIAPVGRGFIFGGLEWFASRLPLDGTGVDAFVLFDDMQFFDRNPVNQEQFGFAQLTVKREVTEAWQFLLGLEYLYQDQYLDVSTQTELSTARVQGHGAWIRPEIQVHLTPKLYLGAEFGINRQFFRAPLDDYWESGPRLTVGFEYGYRSSFELSYEALDRTYDTFTETDAQGNPIPGTQRAYLLNDVKGTLRHYYGANRRWRSSLRLGYRNNQDNGSGYYDYDRYFASHQLSFRAQGWDLQADVGYYYYAYPVQTVGNVPGAPNRRRGELRVEVRAEKELMKFFKIYAQYAYENVDSNDPLYSYSVSEVSSGFIWIF